jgi:hypothetical protein
MLRNVHNDAMTKTITCQKNDAMVKDFDIQYEDEKFKLSHLQLN